MPHAGGVAGPWARTAQPGQVVYLTDARGWYAPPDDSAWQLLIADLTGLPALERIVEESARPRPGPTSSSRCLTTPTGPG